MRLDPIGCMRTPYPTKFGVPRQPQLAPDVPSTIVLGHMPEKNRLHAEYCVPGSYLWLIWGFTRNAAHAQQRFQPTVRPPRLGGNDRIGVFATRSSFRPNSLAISAVQIAKPPQPYDDVMHISVRGADMVDGTPIYAMRPYLASQDARHADASSWVDEHEWTPLELAPISTEDMEKVPAQLHAGLLQMLSLDPRPAYTRQFQPGREFWLPFAQLIVFFTVADSTLTVTHIAELDDEELSELRECGSLSTLDSHLHEHNEGGKER